MGTSRHPSEGTSLLVVECSRTQSQNRGALRGPRGDRERWMEFSWQLHVIFRGRNLTSFLRGPEGSKPQRRSGPPSRLLFCPAWASWLLPAQTERCCCSVCPIRRPCWLSSPQVSSAAGEGVVLRQGLSVSPEAPPGPASRTKPHSATATAASHLLSSLGSVAACEGGTVSCSLLTGLCEHAPFSPLPCCVLSGPPLLLPQLTC